MLSESVCTLRAVRVFVIVENSFRGTLPESGVRAMTVARVFEIDRNSLAGAIPESGLREMQALT
eukprot:5194741-Amphidinium_carterae.1